MNDTTPMLRELTIRYAAKPDPLASRSCLDVRHEPTRCGGPPHARVLGDGSDREVFCPVPFLDAAPGHRVPRSEPRHPEQRRRCTRAVFQRPLANAAALVLAHVHPERRSDPSPDDLALTRRLVAAGRLSASMCSTTSSSAMTATSASTLGTV